MLSSIPIVMNGFYIWASTVISRAFDATVFLHDRLCVCVCVYLPHNSIHLTKCAVVHESSGQNKNMLVFKGSQDSSLFFAAINYQSYPSGMTSISGSTVSSVASYWATVHFS